MVVGLTLSMSASASLYRPLCASFAASSEEICGSFHSLGARTAIAQLQIQYSLSSADDTSK